MSGAKDAGTSDLAQRAEADPGITRRDFVGSTLLGAGATLLSMASPATMREARAQTTPSALTGLGPDWTGPGGIGDYAQSNGNTHEVVNAAHAAIRDQEFDTRLRSATDTGEHPDVIIVGCGISGLAACWTYRKSNPRATVLMLDPHAIFGGEAKQNEFEVDGYHLTAPQGANGFGAPLSRIRQAGVATHFMDDLGLPPDFVLQEPTGLGRDVQVPEDAWFPMHPGWWRSDTGFFYEGKGWVTNPWRDGFRNAPISEAAKRALMMMELYRTPPRRPDWRQWLDSMTYQEFLAQVVGIEPEPLAEVVRYINPVAASWGCGLGADVISAYSAYDFHMPGVIGYARYETGGTNPMDWVYIASFPGGHAGTVRLFVKKILPGAFYGDYQMAEILNSPVRWDQLDRSDQPVRMRLSSTVVSVVHDGPAETAKGVLVTYLRNGKLYKVRAGAAILCSPQHVNRHICRDISPEYRAAMATFHHAPILTVNIAVRNWRFLEKLGIAAARWFEGFGWWVSLRRNIEIPGLPTQPLDPSKPTVLSMYNPFLLPGIPFPQQCTLARMQLFGMTYAQIEAGVRQQFTKMFGDYGFDAGRDIAGIITNRWGHAYVVDPPGFYFGKDGKPAAKDVISRRFGRLSFGHSELSGGQRWAAAAAEGERAAHQILTST